MNIYTVKIKRNLKELLACKQIVIFKKAENLAHNLRLEVP